MLELTLPIVCEINKGCLREGERFHILDNNRLESAIGNQWAPYPTDEQVIASIYKSLVINHAFENGNKRTAYLVLLLLSESIGKEIKLNDSELYDLTLKLANEGGSQISTNSIANKLFGMDLEEDIEKQADTIYKYKEFSIEYFPITWNYKGKTEKVDTYIIKSPYYLQSNPEKDRYYLPLYCEDEKGNDINFKTLDSAKDYIDKYIVTKKGKVVIKHGDEVHFELLNKVEDELDESLNETIEKHDTLNPLLWNPDNTLKDEVKEKILEIVKEFTDGLEENEIKFKIKDIKLVGSNCSYNYNKDSDLDIHIVMDTKSLHCPDNLYPLLYSAFRSLFNGKFDIDFYGIPVELFVETDDTEDLNKESIDN